MATIFELASRARIQKVGEGILPCDAGPETDSRALPPDLMEEAARRLGVAALVYAVTYFLAYFVSCLISGVHGGPIELFFLYPRSWVAWAAILFALGVFGLSRSGRLPPYKVLNGGLGLMVIGLATGAVILALVRPHAAPPPPPIPEAGPVLPDCDGALRELVIQYVSSAVDIVAPTYRDFLRQLPADVIVHVGARDGP